MAKAILSAVLSVLSALALSGCARHLAHAQPDPDPYQLVGEPDFAWSLSGDPRVAPLQVFSDAWRIWLQWHPGQPVPAVLVLEFGQWKLAPVQTKGKYSIVEGHWPQIRFQGGGLRADAIRTNLAPARPAAAALVNSPQACVRFETHVSDGTVRQTLARWANQADWRFENSHWAVPVDVPVTAKAGFEGDFQTAVRGLLDAVQMTGRALQPCFYSNQVLRVISANEVCDVSAQTAGRP
ncbi:TcpQ domain-containing protein [Orrella sp. 11846]|uniref:TcpQ domain-containing protein n=1 Tax=Orrella sp. 11846 TaxID=3409913 RepID=UPI003B5A2569